MTALIFGFVGWALLAVIVCALIACRVITVRTRERDETDTAAADRP